MHKFKFKARKENFFFREAFSPYTREAQEHPLMMAPIKEYSSSTSQVCFFQAIWPLQPPLPQVTMTQKCFLRVTLHSSGAWETLYIARHPSSQIRAEQKPCWICLMTSTVSFFPWIQESSSSWGQNNHIFASTQGNFSCLYIPASPISSFLLVYTQSERIPLGGTQMVDTCQTGF